MHMPDLGPRAVRTTAWCLFGLSLLLQVGALALIVAQGLEVDVLDQLMVVLTLGFGLTGALVAGREPGNAVGWLMLVVSAAFAADGAASTYAHNPDFPHAAQVAWTAIWTWHIWLFLPTLTLPLLFPDGHLLSPRWRWALGLGFMSMALMAVSEAVTPGPLDVDSPEPLANPFAIEGTVAAQVLGAAGTVGGLLAAVGFVLGIASLAVRLRRSRGRERQQLKWFAYVGSLAIVGLFLAIAAVLIEANGDRPPFWAEVIGSIGWLTALLSIVIGIPVAIGIAILRHRLYDIDLVIKRTLVYGTLTATLLATYLVSVLLLQVLLRPVAGESDLAVAASTLAVAALFRPLRSAIQRVVDRRFFRHKYDAARTVESFAVRLRQEVDLDTVSADLRAVTRETIQPAHVSLWLRSTR